MPDIEILGSAIRQLPAGPRQSAGATVGIVQMRVTGLKELFHSLQAINDDVCGLALLEAMQNCNTLLEETARPLTPVGREPHRKKLINSYQKVAGVVPERGQFFAIFSNTAPHAHLAEYGTLPHDVMVRNKRVLADVAAGKVFGRKVRIAARAHPFMRPTWDIAKDKLLPLIERSLQVALARHTR